MNVSEFLGAPSSFKPYIPFSQHTPVGVCCGNSRTLHIKMFPFHSVLIMNGYAECRSAQEWVHEGENAPLLIG